MDDCLFCQIVRGETAADIVYQDEEILAFRDINPKSPIHILIIPKKHFDSLNNIEEADEMLMGKMIHAAKMIAGREQISELGYRLLINIGDNAGQVIKHLHFHLQGGKKLDF